jgi:UDP-N-acetylglucosamine diphosphorylase / glucose-1-phosphate thymidylyltransferase / UDP-N-acetylgalactosamine diphosphorylase / glucosamine-1-phosphate N-acetyltransferase / galactosamine-1-phosphate N-acetyltransferase
VKISDFVENSGVPFSNLAPWQATSTAPDIVAALVAAAGDDFIKQDGNAIHHTSVVEAGAVVKGPVFVGPRCLVAAGAYLRGGVWLEGDCIVGPYCELKTTFMFGRSKTAHLNFVGDSVLGRNVNIEAGAMIANYRNERADKAIWFWHNGQRFETGVDKFGAMVPDNVRIGANAVVAPGAVLQRNAIVGRLALVDQTRDA